MTPRPNNTPIGTDVVVQLGAAACGEELAEITLGLAANPLLSPRVIQLLLFPSGELDFEDVTSSSLLSNDPNSQAPVSVSGVINTRCAGLLFIVYQVAPAPLTAPTPVPTLPVFWLLAVIMRIATLALRRGQNRRVVATCCNRSLMRCLRLLPPGSLPLLWRDHRASDRLPGGHAGLPLGAGAPLARSP